MNYLEIAGALIGLLYLWFEYRASIWLWPVSVIMPAIYIVVYYQVGLYADSVISIYYMFVVLLVVFVLIGIILETCTDSTVPWWDSFTTALSIIAMWMLAHKYVEQWLVWLVVDIVSCGIYIYKDLYFTSFLYGLYAVIACFGYLKWKQLMNLSYERV